MCMQELNDIVTWRDDTSVIGICCQHEAGISFTMQEMPPVIQECKNIKHYEMCKETVAKAKSILEFGAVPYLVVLAEDGSMIKKGNRKKIPMADFIFMWSWRLYFKRKCTPFDCWGLLTQVDDKISGPKTVHLITCRIKVVGGYIEITNTHHMQQKDGNIGNLA